MTKTVLVCGDSHCGHRAGLTPPGWQLRAVAGEDEVYAKRREKWAELQSACWKWFCAEASKLRPIHLLILMGDMIDGAGSRTGGTELIVTDRNAQVDMALKWIRWLKPKNTIMVHGTPYHAGDVEDMEDIIAGQLECKIGDHEWPEVNGVVFDCKHFLPGSSIPHGKGTALLREDLWNALWHEFDEQPRADILVRAHVHWYLGLDGVRRGRPWRATTIPALQGMGTKFGARRMSQHVDFGFVHVDVTDKGDWTWVPHIAELAAQKAHTLKF